jgi:Ca2+/Na+ antiporter
MKLKSILSNIRKYIITGILFLGIIMIYVGLGAKSSSFNIYFLLVGILIFLPFIIYLFYSKFEIKKEEKKNQINLDTFKLKAEKVQFNLDEIEIKSNSWSEEVVIDNSKYGGLNQLAGIPEKNIELIKHNLHHLKIRIPHNGIIYNCDTKININKDDLMIKLAIKKKTFLYVNQFNRKEYYLDIDFLME